VAPDEPIATELGEASVHSGEVEPVGHSKAWELGNRTGGVLAEYAVHVEAGIGEVRERRHVDDGREPVQPCRCFGTLGRPAALGVA
jgi:hypothetical protein